MVKFIILALFVVLMIAIGIYSKSKIKDISDFFLAGRKMGAWMTAFAYGTTYFSAVIFIGYAGRIGWNFGVSAVWIGLGNAVVGALLPWLILGKKTRKMTHELNASTMPEFFAKRYDSMALKIAAALIIFIFLVPYCASVYQGLGYLFENTFGINYIYCMAAMAFITGIYLLLGGYVATALNDFIQGIIMLAGTIAMVLLIVTNPAVGGVAGGISKLSQIAEVGSGLASAFSASPLNLFGLVILTSLGTWGLPHMIHKFYAIKDEAAIRRGTIISFVFSVIIAGGAYFSGVFGRLFLDNTAPLGANGKPNLDMVIPQMLDKALPEVLLGLIIILVLSASMSTLSSLVLISSSSISMDLVKGVFVPKMDKSKVMLLMRILCAVFVAASFAVAVTPNAILTLMSFSWGTVAGSFIAPFIYGLYWKGTTKAGAWAGFITGFGVSVGGALIYGLNASLAPNIGAVAMLASLVTVPLVSLLTAKSSKSLVEKVFGRVKSDISA